MIQIDRLTVRYGGRPALSDVTLRIPAGQRVAVVGSNGAGKTTLIRALLALAPFEGTARVGGYDVRRDGVLARALVGYVPQVVQFPPNLTAGEVIALFQDLRGVSTDPLDALEAVGLSGVADRPAGALSGGMARRLTLAVSQIGNPAVLLFDEPTSHLDREGERLILTWLEGAVGAGRTALLASHHLQGLEAVVDRVVLLEEGRVAADEEMSALAARRWVEVVTSPPLPSAIARAAVLLPSRNGNLHLKVPAAALADVIRSLDGRSIHIHEASLEELIREDRP